MSSAVRLSVVCRLSVTLVGVTPSVAAAVDTNPNDATAFRVPARDRLTAPVTFYRRITLLNVCVSSMANVCKLN